MKRAMYRETLMFTNVDKTQLAANAVKRALLEELKVTHATDVTSFVEEVAYIATRWADEWPNDVSPRMQQILAPFVCAWCGELHENPEHEALLIDFLDEEEARREREQLG